ALQALDLRGQGSQAALDFELDANSAQAALATRGRIGRRGVNWEGRIAALELTAEPGPALRLQDPAGFRYGPRLLQLDRSCLVAQDIDGRLCVVATGNTLQLQGETLPLALAQPWLPTDEAAPLFIHGVVDLDARLQQGRDGRWRGEGELRSATGGLRLDPDSGREVFGYRDLLLTLTLAGDAIVGQLDAALPDDGRIAATLRTGLAASAPLSGTLQLDVRDLTWLELFSQDIADPTGKLQGQLSLGGSRAAPAVAGQARLVEFATELPALGLKLREGEFLLLGEADGSARVEGSVRSGDGVLRVDGSLNLRDTAAPLQLVLRGDRVTVASTAAFYAVASPDLSLRFADGQIELRGSVVVPEARLDLELLDTNVEVSPDVVVLDPLDPPRERSRPLDMDFTMSLGDQVVLKGFGLDGRMAGSLDLRQRPGRSARASGALDVTGTYKAYGRLLTIERARLGFANSPFDDPTLDILAQREFDDVTVGVQVRGSASRPETTVVSTPAMDTNEALSWLILGRPLAAATGTDAARVDAAQMALGAGGTLIAQQLGTQLGLDVAGVSDSRNLGGATFTLGKYVSPRLFISYGVSLVGTGQVVTLKYLLRRGFDISIESGNENAASVNWRTER
ncbi:MAG: translocation/assembly module TamB domain-containing protein, partial [Arenimonas sp.]|nr:translocation/assembly module TamB domain-containing protein [Arenimonas sp.]